jgi:chromatin remodeling complex protein RSC6
MWAYIKENNLQDPKNKQMIKCDDKLSKVRFLQKFTEIDTNFDGA